MPDGGHSMNNHCMCYSADTILLVVTVMESPSHSDLSCNRDHIHMRHMDIVGSFLIENEV